MNLNDFGEEPDWDKELEADRKALGFLADGPEEQETEEEIDEDEEEL